MSRKIVITSGKGGVGKTTVTVGLARALADLSQRVVVIDADLSLSNLDVCCDVEQNIMFDIVDCIKGRCRVKQALIQDPIQPSMYVLAGNSGGLFNVTKDDLLSVTEQLSALFDYCLLDCAAGLGEDFDKAVSCANQSIVVCTPHLSSIRDAVRTVTELSNYNLAPGYVIINRARGDLIVKGKMLSPIEVFSLIKGKPLGVIPESDEVNCNEQTAESNAYFSTLAKNLHFGKSIMIDCEAPYRKRLSIRTR